MEIEVLKIIIITFALIIGISALTIPAAFLLAWLDSKGIIDKITKRFRKNK